MRLGKILFIHIPRTGGTHFEKLLGFKGHDEDPPCGSLAYGSDHSTIMGWDPKLKIMLQHVTYRQLIEHKFIKVEDESLIKVSIVRNPYHRTISLYKYFGGSKKWESFYNFLMLLDKKLKKKYFYLSQFDYLEYHGEVKVDQIIRFEDYKKGLKDFIRSHQISLDVVFDTKLQNIRMAENKKNYLFDQKSVELIEKIYQKDFDAFDYQRISEISEPTKIITKLSNR